MKSFNQRSLFLWMMVLIAAVIFTSCKKSEIKLTPLASLNVTNAIVGGKTAKLGSVSTTISNNNYTAFGILTGSRPIYIYPTSDSLFPYYNGTIAANRGDVYSLFLAGADTMHIDTILVKETIPYHTDSTAGIRFINLSPNSAPLNITLSTTPTVNEVTSLAYKQMTGFLSYAGLYNSTYTFQVRDAANPTVVLTSVSFTAASVPRFANVTLVIRGLEGASPVLGITIVKNDR